MNWMLCLNVKIPSVYIIEMSNAEQEIGSEEDKEFGRWKIDIRIKKKNKSKFMVLITIELCIIYIVDWRFSFWSPLDFILNVP